MTVRLLLFLLQSRLLIAAALSMCGFCTVGAEAQSVEDFYKGKTITLIDFSVPGGPYDIYARLLVQFLPKYIPGHPAVVTQFMPGAGGLKAARYLYEAAPRDGTTIGVLSQTLIFEPLLGGNVGNTDYQKFGWLGSMSQSTALFVSWKTSQVKTAQDLFQHDLLIAGTGAASETTVVVAVLNGILGTRIKLVQGYAGSPAAMLAMEQGEVDGAFPTSDTLTLHPDWLSEHKINFLMQTRQIPDPAFAEVPTAISLAKTDRQRQELQFLFPRDTIGRPFMTPPGLPADRLKALQAAFAASLQDPDLIAEAKKTHLRIDLTRGEDLAKVIDDEYATPADILTAVRAVIPKTE